MTACMRVTLSALSNNLWGAQSVAIRCFSVTTVNHKLTKKVEGKKFIRYHIHPQKWTEPLQEYLQEQKEAGENKPENEEPHMLHMVTRVKTLNGRPWWEKDVCKELSIGEDTKMHQPVIHKNIPGVNRRLEEIKHLVVIKKVTFPHGMPEDESDFEHTILKTNGEMLVKKKLPQYESETRDDPEEDKWKLQGETVKKAGLWKLQNKMVNAEYFEAHYKYRRNQDGKEYRYSHNTGPDNVRNRGYEEFTKK